ncbi:hypothetical protein ACSN7O_003568 [Enterobacter chuandaensis]
MLHSKNVGGTEIFRASEAHERKVYNRVKECVFRHFSPGLYTDKTDIVNIVNLMYREYYAILDEYLPAIPPRKFVAFLTEQYEQYGKVSDAHKLGKLSDEDEVFWSSWAIYARRGIKHIMELLCRSRMEPGNADGGQALEEDAISMVFIAAEELVSLYMRSDNYRNILDEVTLTLDPDEYIYFHVAQDSSHPFDKRQAFREISKYVPVPMFLQDTAAHAEVLDADFTETTGISYKDTLGVIQWLIDTCSDKEQPGQPGSFVWKEAVGKLTHAFSITASQAELIIGGFSLSADNMDERELFRPKQEYRAYKRGFFRDQSPGVDQVFFSRRMALECLTLLVSDVPFRKLPPEWQSRSVNKALNTLSLRAGRWFENVVANNLAAAGIIGSTSVKAISLNKNERVKIPADIGEIDFLGFHEEKKILVIIEVKQVGFATEPRMYQDDLSKFTGGQDNYSTRFIKKYRWVLENIDSVKKYLHHKFGFTSELNTAGYAMVTLYPTIAATKIEAFTCISVSEFMHEYHENEKWPFSQTSLR